jgi:hypothetical protein
MLWDVGHAVRFLRFWFYVLFFRSYFHPPTTISCLACDALVGFVPIRRALAFHSIAIVVADYDVVASQLVGSAAPAGRWGVRGA